MRNKGSVPFSLRGGDWLVEIGLKGSAQQVNVAIEQLQNELDARGAAWRLGKRL